MKNIFILTLGLLLLAGCSSKSNFYQLHPNVKEGRSGHSTMRHKVIGIAEVEVSEYLDKPQIVTRLSEGRIEVHEEERWAGTFPKNIQYVLKDNLSRMIPKYTFIAYPWEEPLSDVYRVYLTIEKFDGDTATGTVVLKGRWSLVGQNDNVVLVSETFDYSEKGKIGLEGMVDTQSRLLERLSRRIAKKIAEKV